MTSQTPSKQSFEPQPTQSVPSSLLDKQQSLLADLRLDLHLLQRHCSLLLLSPHSEYFRRTLISLGDKIRRTSELLVDLQTYSSIQTSSSSQEDHPSQT